MSGRSKSIANVAAMSNQRSMRKGLHPLAKINQNGETDSGSDRSDADYVPSNDEAETSTHQEGDDTGLQFIVWSNKRKTSPTLPSLTQPQMEMLLDLDQQGVRFQTIKSNVTDGLKGNLAAATSKYMVKAYKFLTTINPNITIEEAAAHPVFRNRKL